MEVKMLILLIVITIGFIILFSFTDIEELVAAMIVILGIEIIALLICAGCLVNTRVIDEKIELYEKQNKEIENKIEITVKNYMEYEGNTFKELKPESYIQLVNLYPDLKADQLIQQQMNLYISNNEKIISLKENKKNKTVYKWWLYFGK